MQLKEYRMSNGSTDEWNLRNTECLVVALTNEAYGMQNV
jgi:hypothetical protein